MHDKYARRRRAVLALLVVASLVLLTAYFGESEDSPLHSVQRGIVEVFSPIQHGASTVLSPVRDVAGWMSATIDAKSQNTQLRQEIANLTRLYDAAKFDALQDRRAASILHLDVSDHLDQYGLVTASVEAQNSSLWYRTVEIDQGSDDGVADGDPVISDYGLVGDVSQVGPNYAIVSELFDDKFSVGALVLDGSGRGAGDTGELQPKVGAPNTLVLDGLPTQDTQIADGQAVVTSGFDDSANPSIHSLYPAGIPIGTITSVNDDTVLNDQEVTVTPDVDLRHLSVVQVLTRATAGTQRASLTAP